ncbi:hypothetical protein [Paenibacillus taichungensis]|uniref:hypothetical protein n=1 Tax=Paenibacillus taichungensis TaxID=484184 RepID=UPI0039A3DD14
MKNLTAKEFGRNAFNNGIKRVPCLDVAFLDTHIKGLPVGGGASELMKQWTAGWDEENFR